MNEQDARSLLEIADDELVLGWRDSEWTGIAPFLEEDVAFSSIAQNEIGHARALYELVAREHGTTADELAFDRAPDTYRCTQLVELRLMEWEKTIARHYLYETADGLRLERLKESSDPEIAGLAAKIDREEAYHRIHAQMWFDRLQNEPRFTAALQDLWLLAQAVVPDDLRPQFAARMGLSTESGSEPQSRTEHTAEFPELWEEMTVVRRSQPAGTRW
ncbi:MAG: phenylacetate-CoA oxygenase subunit PaaC [Actinobacteria bacterium]|nr:MAG: phenylacetate-CoA oxygenase subunit PaaC [Actinomycetota bacterium]